VQEVAILLGLLAPARRRGALLRGKKWPVYAGFWRTAGSCAAVCRNDGPIEAGTRVWGKIFP